MKTKLIICIFALMLAPALAAAEEQSFSVYSGESITIDKQVITIYLSGFKEGIFAEYGGKYISISNNSCESTDYFKLCLDNIEQDYTAKKKKISIRGISTVPSITITRTASKSDLMVWEESVLTVQIANTGGVARNATYLDTFPEDVEIKDIMGARLRGNSVYWTGEIGGSSTRDIEYKVRPKAKLKQGLKASFTYFDGYQMKTAYSSEITFDVSHSVKIDATVGKTPVYVGENNTLKINVTNRGNNSANATVNIQFSPDIEVVDYPHTFYKAGKNSYSYTREFSKRNKSNDIYYSYVYKFDIKSRKTGSSDTTISSSYTDIDTLETANAEDTHKYIVAEDKGIKIRTSLADKVIESNQRYTVQVFVQNLNPFDEVTDVLVTANTDLGYVPDVFLDRMSSQAQKKVIEKDFFASNTTTTTGASLVANVTYKLGGDKKTYTFRDTITIYPVKELVINHLLSKTTVNSGEDFFVTVTVQNPRTTDINKVKVYDTVPENLTVTGKNTALASITKKSTATIYTYKLTAPRVSKETKFKIRTGAEYSDADSEFDFAAYNKYNYSKETEFTVLPVKFTLSPTRLVRETDTYKGNVISIDYTVKNEDDSMTAKDVVLHFPLQQYLDLVNYLNYSLPEIEPGEAILAPGKERIRAKTNGTYNLLSSYVTYKNQYGDSFAYNASGIALNLKESPIYGPAVIVSKDAPDKVNDTDSFIVQLNVSNIGDQPASVQVSDGEVQFTAIVSPQSYTTYRYSTTISQPGTYKLPIAVARYSYNNMSLYTGSNIKAVEVENNPLVRIERILPEKANNVDSINSTLRITSLSPTPLSIGVTDGAYNWQLGAVTGQKDISREISFDTAGQKIIEPAYAYYSFINRTYNVSSGTYFIDIKEKKFVTIRKAVLKKDVKLGQNITVNLTLKNEQSYPLTVTITEAEKKWNYTLEPDLWQSTTYKTEATSSTLDPTTITVEYKNRTFQYYSEELTLDIPGGKLKKAKNDIKNETKNETATPSESQQKPDEGILKRIINGIVSILSWKRAS